MNETTVPDLNVILIFNDNYTCIVREIKSRRLRWAGHVAIMEEGRSTFKILASKPTGKRPLGWGGAKRRWEENIRMNLKVVDINTRKWVDSPQDTYYWRALVHISPVACH